MKRFEHLKAWQACRDLTVAVYRVTNAFPASELYGLVSQTRRASISAAANIAEGTGRRGNREFRRFLDVALGSLSEVSCLLMLAGDLGYLSPQQQTELEIKRDHANRLTWGLYRSAAAASTDPPRPSAHPPIRRFPPATPQCVNATRSSAAAPTPSPPIWD